MPTWALKLEQLLLPILNTKARHSHAEKELLETVTVCGQAECWCLENLNLLDRNKLHVPPKN